MEKWYILLFLLCPLMHFFMMRGHKHGDHASCHDKGSSDVKDRDEEVKTKKVVDLQKNL